MADCQNGNSQLEAAFIHRILDANLNRASEGLRVAEEFARMVLEDAFLARSLKEARHRLGESAKEFTSNNSRLAFRDTQNDVGTTISTESETRRAGLKEVAEANFKRAQQSLRNLEEYGKVLSAAFAQASESLRYELYTLEKAVLGARDLNSPIAAARVYVLMDGKSDTETFEQEAREIAGAADVIQLRDKNLSDATLLDRAKRLRTLTRQTQCLFIMNDRPDLAVLAQADGVHLGQDEISVAETRRIVGKKTLIGVSTHSIEQVRKAVLDGASYLGCGPVFPSGTKAFEYFPGLEFLREAARETSLPSFAIGGIGPVNLNEVMDAGFTRIAVQGAVINSRRSSSEEILSMKEKLTRARAT